MPDELQREPVLKAKSEFRRRIRGLSAHTEDYAELFLEHFRRISGGYACLVGYMPMHDEPDCRRILEHWLNERGNVLLPVFDGCSHTYGLASVGGLGKEWLCAGNYGIAEPLQDLPRMRRPYHFEGGCAWLVPGLAFSRNGIRLGRGAGYYDRLLAGSNAVKIGLTYEDRVFDWLPAEEHDVKMDYLLTETGLAGVN
jgi:5-formyltetrahydrofolate cyclo-ligase